MDLGPDRSKPRSASYRETFRRHRKLLCIPPILGVLVAGLFLFGMGKTYTSTAGLWVDTSPPAPSSIAADSGPLTQPPAVAEQALLNELLATRTFLASIAKNSALRKSLGSTGPIRENAGQLPGNGQLASWAVGSQVLQISYSASSAAMAKGVVAAVIAQLRSYTDRLTAQHNQAAVAYDKNQVKVAATALATARANVADYQARHPGVTRNDPNYASLVAAQSNALAQLGQANTAQTTSTSNGGTWSTQAIDPPSQASATPLRKRKIAELIVGGALGGALLSFLAVVALTPVKKEVWEDELPIGAPLVPDTPPADPFWTGSSGIPTTPASTSAATAARQPRLSLGDRRFQARTRSTPSEEE